MDLNEENPNRQRVVAKTELKSTTHRFALIWHMRCGECGAEYGSNSCDAHIRRCPQCDRSAAPGEPLG